MYFWSSESTSFLTSLRLCSGFLERTMFFFTCSGIFRCSLRKASFAAYSSLSCSSFSIIFFLFSSLAAFWIYFIIFATVYGSASFAMCKNLRILFMWVSISTSWLVGSGKLVPFARFLSMSCLISEMLLTTTASIWSLMRFSFPLAPFISSLFFSKSIFFARVLFSLTLESSILILSSFSCLIASYSLRLISVYCSLSCHCYISPRFPSSRIVKLAIKSAGWLNGNLYSSSLLSSKKSG